MTAARPETFLGRLVFDPQGVDRMRDFVQPVGGHAEGDERGVRTVVQHEEGPCADVLLAFIDPHRNALGRKGSGENGSGDSSTDDGDHAVQRRPRAVVARPITTAANPNRKLSNYSARAHR